MAVAQGYIVNSGEKTTITSITQAVVVPYLINGCLNIRIASRGGTLAGLTISSVTVNGLNADFVRSDDYSDTDAGRLRTEVWKYSNPPIGSYNVVVTFGGTVNFSVVTVEGLTGVDVKNPIDASNGNNGLAQASPLSTSITTLTDGAYIVDSVYSKTGGAIAVQTGQTQDTNVPVNSSGDQAGGSHKILAAAGATTMQWTYTAADDFCQTVVAFRAKLPQSFNKALRPHPFSPGLAR